MRIVIVLLLITALHAGAQSTGKYFVTVNHNVYLPISSGKRPISLIGIEKDPTTIVIGGFGVGGCTWIALSEKRDLKVQANLSRVSYWDEPLNLRDINNRDLGTYKTFSIDYSVGTSATLKYDLNDRWSWGPGLGFQTMIFSTLYLTNDEVIEGRKRKVTRNRHQKMVMPTLPVELTWNNDRIIVNFRYEQALLNRTARALGRYSKETYGLWFVEVGFKM